jgi:predicted amidophosphoribosyltransferase
MTIAGVAETGTCPVCRASFRGAENCPRCGAHLGKLMLISAYAYALRRTAVERVLAGDAQAALAAVEAAQGLQATMQGEKLLRVCQAAVLQRSTIC